MCKMCLIILLQKSILETQCLIIFPTVLHKYLVLTIADISSTTLPSFMIITTVAIAIVNAAMTNATMINFPTVMIVMVVVKIVIVD